MTKIAFIGCGNMASCIINAILKDKDDSLSLVASGPHIEKLEKFKALGVDITTDNSAAASISNIIFLGVKPQILPDVLNNMVIMGVSFKDKLVISMAVGFSSKSIADIIKSDKIIRIMPNTPSKIGLGVSAVFFDKGCNDSDKEIAKNLLKNLGLSVFVDDEEKITTLGAITGSGPAFIYKFLESLSDIAIQKGFDEEETRLFIEQLILGTATLIVKNHDTKLSTMREAVTSKGGTTFEGLKTMDKNNFKRMMDDTIDACITRSHELENILKDK